MPANENHLEAALQLKKEGDAELEDEEEQYDMLLVQDFAAKEVKCVAENEKDWELIN